MEYRIVLTPLDREKKRWEWYVQQKCITYTKEDGVEEEYEYWRQAWAGTDLYTHGRSKGRERALKRAQFVIASLEDKDSFLEWQQSNTEIIYD